MLSDGYFDMSSFIYGRYKKDLIYSKLIADNSKYAILYKKSYPKKENAFSLWKEIMGLNQNDKPIVLTNDEAIAIVNWVYRALNNSLEREDFTKSLFNQIKEFYGIKNYVRLAQGVVYNSAKVDIHFLSSVSAVNNFISQIKKTNNTLFYRGHANANYTLCPSIMRSSQLIYNENKLYNELLINCPNDFSECHTHLEKLVKMQHYGLPTRLIDITRNPLVALFFACNSHPESYGEILLITANSDEIKYPQSDTISLISSLPNFTYENQINFRESSLNKTISKKEFNQKISRLIHEVRLEKPAFQPEVNQCDLLNSYIVYALKNNNRIVKQDGAFILCGLNAEDESSLGKFRYCEQGKRIILLINNKSKIQQQLDNFSVNNASLFPEIENVAEYLKNKYTK